MAFCRLTQQGFLRLATNRAAFADDALPLIDAWRSYDAFLADQRIQFAPEPPELESAWREYTSARTYSPKLWSDAYLAAFARSGAFTLVTCDRAFQQFARVDVSILR